MHNLFYAWLRQVKNDFGDVSVVRDDGNYQDTISYDGHLSVLRSDGTGLRVHDWTTVIEEIPSSISECFNTGKYDVAIVLQPDSLVTFLCDHGVLITKSNDYITDTPILSFALDGVIYRMRYARGDKRCTEAVINNKWNLFDYLVKTSAKCHFGCLRYDNLISEWLCCYHDCYTYDTNLLLFGSDIPDSIGETPVECDDEWLYKRAQEGRIKFTGHAALLLDTLHGSPSSVIPNLRVVNGEAMLGTTPVDYSHAARMVTEQMNKLLATGENTIEVLRNMSDIFLQLNRTVSSVYLSSKHYSKADNDYVVHWALHSAKDDRSIMHMTSGMYWYDAADEFLVRNCDKSLFDFVTNGNEPPIPTSFDTWLKFAKDEASVAKIRECLNSMEEGLFVKAADILRTNY